MLRPAQLYENQLQIKSIETWYKPEYMYYSTVGDDIKELPSDNYNMHCFVSVDDKDEVIGYIQYSVDYMAMSANALSIISFDRGNMMFIRDVYEAVCDIFEKYHMNRLSWFCYADNPAIKGYRQFIMKHGGAQTGYHHEVGKLRDGKLHDMVDFEIMAKDFKK